MKFMIVCVLILLSFVYTLAELPVQGCQKDDGTFMQAGNSHAKYLGHECHECWCWDGIISCSAVQCGWPQCPDGAKPVFSEDNCCPSCPRM